MEAVCGTARADPGRARALALYSRAEHAFRRAVGGQEPKQIRLVWMRLTQMDDSKRYMRKVRRESMIKVWTTNYIHLSDSGRCLHG